ncbi:hypothetical protein D3C72_1376550 [compost metagenome]
MKILSIFASGSLVLASTVAMAYPAVGDKTGYNGSCMKGTETKTWTSTKEVIAWVDASKLWIVKTDVMKNGKTKTDIDGVSEADMWTADKWTDISTNCVAKGGVMEDVTVVAGTFNTCHMTKTDGDGDMKHVWWGDVPGGIVKKVKMDVEDNKTTTIELNSVTLGQ